MDLALSRLKGFSACAEQNFRHLKGFPDVRAVTWKRHDDMKKIVCI